MFTLKKKFTFEASHQLPKHDGKCARLHGHSWVMWVEVQGHEIGKGGPKDAMLMDYGDISSRVKPLVELYLDHWHLNSSLELDSPTSEAIAEWMYFELLNHGFKKKEHCNHLQPWLSAVIVEETCTSACEYRP